MTDILQELRDFRSDFTKQLDGVKGRLSEVEKLKLLVEESHQWIRILVENKEVQKAEMDNLNHKVATVEGVL